MAPTTFLLSSLVLLTFMFVTTTLATPQVPQVSAYFPAYTAGATVNYNYTDLAMYFVDITTKDGFERGAGQSEADMKKFIDDAYANNVKPILTIGGYTGSRYFSSQLATIESRDKLANLILSYLYNNALKGVDISWLYPNQVGIGCNERSPDDTQNLLYFVKHLRGVIGPGYIISLAVSPNGFYIDNTTTLQDYSGLATYIDHINILTLDYTGSWSPVTGTSSPFYSCESGGGVVAAVNRWITGKFPAEKIFITIPSYGYSFITNSSNLTLTRTLDNVGGTDNYLSYLYSPWTKIPKGEPSDTNAPFTDACGKTTSAYKGIWHYTTLKSSGLLSADGSKGLNGFVRHWDACTRTPFLFNSQTKTFISYEDPTSAAIKANYAKEKGLKGVAIFSSEGFDDQVYQSIASKLGSKA